jgi:hypothetical protein
MGIVIGIGGLIIGFLLIKKILDNETKRNLSFLSNSTFGISPQGDQK